MPFDWNQPFTYSIVVIWQSIGVFVTQRFLACLLPLTIGTFLFAFTLSKCWKGDLNTLDKIVRTKQSKTRIIKHINEIVRSHANVKQLSRLSTLTCTALYTLFMFYNNNLLLSWLYDSADICEVSIFANFMCCTIALCLIMMMLQVGILVE